MNIKVGISKALNEVRKIKDIKELVYGSIKLHKDNIAFRYRNWKNDKFIDITYSQLEHDLNALGTALFSLGLHNKKISIIGNNSYWWVVSYLATVCGTRSCSTN